MSDITTEQVDVTPDLAREWLVSNEKNRNAKATKIGQYARDMREGRWHFDGAPIRFDINGKLLDGQHRLRAVVKANTTVPFLVVRGLTPESQATMDQGSIRTAADWLTMQGGKYTQLVQAASRIALGVMYNPAKINGYSSSSAEQLAWIAENPDVNDAATQLSGKYSKIDMNPSLAIYCLWRFNRIDADDAEEFFRGMVEKTNLKDGDPRIALMNRLALARNRRERLNRNMELSMVFRAWNAYRKRETMTVVRTNSPAGGLIPMPEPK